MTKVQAKVTNLLVSVLERDCKRSHPVAATGMKCLQPTCPNQQRCWWLALSAEPEGSVGRHQHLLTINFALPGSSNCQVNVCLLSDNKVQFMLSYLRLKSCLLIAWKEVYISQCLPLSALDQRRVVSLSCTFQRAVLAALCGTDGGSCHFRVHFNVPY